jgi:putative redox protein
MTVERITFQGAEGQQLAARLHYPTGRMRACALFAHCFTCGKGVKAAVRIAEALADHGIGTLRFDFPGLGESEGDFADTNFSTNVDDLVAAADWLRETREAPTILVGHSLGGAAVLSAASRISEALAVATIGAPSDPAHVAHLLAGSAEEIAECGHAEVNIGGRPFTISKHFLDDLAAQSAKKTIAKLGKALLVFHSPQDQIVDVENAATIYQQARHPKSFVSLDGADHMLRRKSDASYVACVLAAWASRYLPTEQELPETEAGHVVVRGGPRGLTQEVETSGHHFVADEPVSVGGDERGPTPYDLLLASLGACTSMTLRMYANHKGFPLSGVRVELVHDRVHAEDCESCEEQAGQVDRIRRRIQLEGELDADQRAKLMRIADRCPVHRTLTKATHIETEAVEG